MPPESQNFFSGKPPPAEGADRILDGVSHQLRTPLAAITGALDLLVDTPLTPEQCRYVEIIRSASQSLLGVVDSLAAAASPRSEPVAPGLLVLNPEQIGALQEEGLLEALTGLFIEMAGPTIDAMASALEKGDAGALSSGAHLLKGSAVNFGAERVVALCQEIEQRSASRPERNAMQHLLETLRAEYEQVETALKNLSEAPAHQ